MNAFCIRSNETGRALKGPFDPILEFATREAAREFIARLEPESFWDRHTIEPMASQRLVTFTCQGCGACCLTVGLPPLLPAEFEALPPGLHDELAAIEKADPELATTVGPCPWLDMDSRQCRHYDFRPLQCRDYPLGSQSCKTAREIFQIGSG